MFVNKCQRPRNCTDAKMQIIQPDDNLTQVMGIIAAVLGQRTRTNMATMVVRTVRMNVLVTLTRVIVVAVLTSMPFETTSSTEITDTSQIGADRTTKDSS